MLWPRITLWTWVILMIYITMFCHAAGSDGTKPATSTDRMMQPLLGKKVNVTSVRYPDYNKILRGDSSEIKHVKEMLFKEARKPATDEEIIKIAANCPDYISRRTYSMQPWSDEEAGYPIAFILTVHRGSEQVERLLRTIYAPQNIYCIHVDVKASSLFKKAVEAVTNCFPNVFLASRPIDVVYGGFTRLMADIQCMQDLMQSPQPWYYIINMCGQEMPLKTNLEISRVLKRLNGLNDIAGVLPQNDHIKRRFMLQHEEGVDRPLTYHSMKLPPPGNITIPKGSEYNMYTREFVEFVLHDPFAVALREWFRDTYTPDEHYWATLQYLEGTPGGKIKPSSGSMARAIKWQHMGPKHYPHCEGHYQRKVCVYGVGDLNWLIQRNNIIANKFDIESDHVAIACLEFWLATKTAWQHNTA